MFLGGKIVPDEVSWVQLKPPNLTDRIIIIMGCYTHPYSCIDINELKSRFQVKINVVK